MLEESLKFIKDAELDIELLNRKNEKLCAENNIMIKELKENIEQYELILQEELKKSGEKKLECKLGYCSFRTMPDKWIYDDIKIIRWCKENDHPYFHTVEILEKNTLKESIKNKNFEIKDVPGLTVTPQEPKFNYKIK